MRRARARRAYGARRGARPGRARRARCAHDRRWSPARAGSRFVARTTAPASAQAISSASTPSAVIARAVARASARSGGRRWRSNAARGASGVMRQVLEQRGCVLEREAAVALTVGVRALERPPGVDQQQRAGRQQRRPVVAAVVERARQHQRDRDPGRALLERCVARPAGADHVGDTPALAFGHDAPGDRAGAAEPCFLWPAPPPADRNRRSVPCFLTLYPVDPRSGPRRLSTGQGVREYSDVEKGGR